MQNVDFSKRIRRDSEQVDAPTIHTKNRTYTFVLAACILAFTAGLMAGVQIMRVRGSDNIVRFPDNAPGEPRRVGTEEPARDVSSTETEKQHTSFADTAPSRYLVKVGTFTPEEADKLSRRIAKIPELRDMSPLPCEGLKENPDRGLSFRITVPGSQKRDNLFLGCFRDPAQAHEAIAALKRSAVAPGSAVLFEIE
ncbi:MAG: hypothetical protein K8S54_20500 [Spirochaetia bacterium]|nr:hypothetical protein [Spirochaetia bacterium]